MYLFEERLIVLGEGERVSEVMYWMDISFGWVVVMLEKVDGGRW